MAWNAQLPSYFNQFDATGGSLVATVPDQVGAQQNPLAAKTPAEIAASTQDQLAQLQSQMSSAVGASAGAIAPGTTASVANTTPALTSTASIPASLGLTPATPGAGTTTTTTPPLAQVTSTAVASGTPAVSSHQPDPGATFYTNEVIPQALLGSASTSGGLASSPNDFTGWGSYNLQDPAHLQALQELGLTEQQAQSRYGNENALEASGFLASPAGQEQQRAYSNMASAGYNKLLQMFPDQQQFIRDQMASGLSPENLYSQLMRPGPTTGRVGGYTVSHEGQPGYHPLSGGRWVPNG